MKILDPVDRAVDDSVKIRLKEAGKATEIAPIVQVADYGLAGDLFAVLPELQMAL